MSVIPPRVLENLEQALEGTRYIKFLSFLGSHATPNMLQVLEFSLGKDTSTFVGVVKLMADDAEKTVCDHTHNKVIQDIYSNYLNPIENEITSEKLQLMVADKAKKHMRILDFTFLRALSFLSPSALKATLLEVKRIAVSWNMTIVKTVMNRTAPVTSLSNGSALKKTGYELLAVYVIIEAYQAIVQWCDGKISGKRCAKKIVDSLASAAGGFAGGIAGMGVGASVFGPVGLTLGAIGCGFGGAVVAEMLSDWLTLDFFNLPPSEALEQAFNFMGLEHTATNDEINSKFRQLCLQYHPDKGGKAKDFHKLQASIAVIKVSRRETH